MKKIIMLATACMFMSCSTITIESGNTSYVFAILDVEKSEHQYSNKPIQCDYDLAGSQITLVAGCDKYKIGDVIKFSVVKPGSEVTK